MENEHNHRIKNNLRQILLDRRMQLKELHELTGIGYSALHNIVQEKKKGITFLQLAKICHALNLGVGDIFELETIDNG